MFLVDTNICSAHLRRPSGLTHQFVQHGGNLATSMLNLGELLAWAHKQDDPAPMVAKIDALLSDLILIQFDADCARKFGEVPGRLLRGGVSVSPVDLMIGATALAHDAGNAQCEGFRTSAGAADRRLAR